MDPSHGRLLRYDPRVFGLPGITRVTSTRLATSGSTMTLGSLSITSAGSWDIFFAKVDPKRKSHLAQTRRLYLRRFRTGLA